MSNYTQLHGLTQAYPKYFILFKLLMNMYFYLASCPRLINPNNSMVNCSLGDGEVPSYEDTCSFTCNPGYELTGSNSRTCQSNKNWSGSDALCRRGKVLAAPTYMLCS